MSINSVDCTGNLTKDAELKQMPSGNSILEFSLAVNGRQKNPQSGQWEDSPNYVDCVLYGTRATSLQQHLTKGTKVAVHGRLKWESWTDKTSGSKRSRLRVIADDIDIMSGRKQAATVEDDDDDLPMPDWAR